MTVTIIFTFLYFTMATLSSRTPNPEANLKPLPCNFDPSQNRSIFQYWINPGDNSNILASNIDNDILVSTDCGRSFNTLLGQNAKLFNFKFNAFDSSLILAQMRNVCLKNERECIEHNSLHLSTNKGKSWILIKSFVYEFAWYGAYLKIGSKVVMVRM